jgi:hypothetical protein
MRSNPQLTSQILAVLALRRDRTINEQQTTNCKENPGLVPGTFFMPTLAGFLFVFAYLAKYLQKLIHLGKFMNNMLSLLSIVNCIRTWHS